MKIEIHPKDRNAKHRQLRQAGQPAAPEERLRRLVVQLPDSIHRRFKQLAAEQGVTMSDLCRAWVEEALAEHFG